MNKLLCLALLSLAAVTAQAETKVLIKTNLGEIELSLDEKKAPKTVANFVDYAQSGFYNDSIFHRVIDGFMIQGGGFTEDMKQKPTKQPIVNEAANGLKNTVGSIAMARTNQPNSATSQFFINLAANDFLNYKNSSPSGIGYAVFGRVTKGMATVNKIAKVKTSSYAGHANVPKLPVRIISVDILK